MTLHLELSEPAERLRGRWVIIDYDQSFATRPVRPLLTYRRGAAREIRCVLPAATLGRARWLGLVPPDLTACAFQVGIDDPAGFRLRPVRLLSAWQVRTRLLLRSPAAMLAETIPCLIRTGRVRTINARSGLMREPPGELARFARSRARMPEPDGFDRPVPPDEAPSVALLLVYAGEDTACLSETAQALARQVDPAWSLTVVPADPHAADRLGQWLDRAGTDGRVKAAPPLGAVSDEVRAGWCLGRAGPGRTGWLRPGERLAPWAVLAVRADLRARPGRRLLYTDSALLDGRGEPAEPALLPGWSPEFLRSRNYVSGLCLFEPALARACMGGLDPAAGDFAWQALLRAAETLPAAAVSHLPRMALLRPAGLPRQRPGSGEGDSPSPDRSHPPHPALTPMRSECADPFPAAGEAGQEGRDQGPSVSIIMPTRDRLDLLRPAVESVLGRTRPGRFELVVADNGSADPATLAYLRELGARARVIRQEGPFNFSRIVNAAVAATEGEVIVLLNNDVEVVAPGWLAEMLACLERPDVGAVGAKLLYPDGTVQHSGTVVGWGGYAGHFGRRRPAGTPGLLGRALVRHEVSAVTAACLAVRRTHFEAVGGFDESLAVAFNDVDFCLKLMSLGLRNLMAPQAVLIHRESASRGEDHGARRDRFREERRRFGERWRALIGDDPYFHLGLSLETNTEMLE